MTSAWVVRGFEGGEALLEVGDFAVALDDHALGDADSAFNGESFVVAHAADTIIGFAFELGKHEAFGGFPILVTAAGGRGGGLSVGGTEIVELVFQFGVAAIELSDIVDGHFEAALEIFHLLRGGG